MTLFLASVTSPTSSQSRVAASHLKARTFLGRLAHEENLAIVRAWRRECLGTLDLARIEIANLAAFLPIVVA